MKKKFFSFLIVSVCMAGLISCGSSASKTGSSDKSTENKTAEPDPGVGKMDDFFKMLDGTTAGSAKAYNTYATKGFKDYNANECMPDFCDYELKNPKVISQQGICSTIETTAGITTRTYNICWKNDSISAIEFKGMK